jgi:ABC-2 type transport system permease protein
VIWTLLKPRLLAVKNTVATTPGGKSRGLFFILLGGAFWLGIYAVSHWFVAQCLAIEPVGEAIVRRLLSMALLAIFAVLTFSNLVAAFSTFYLSRDLQLLMPLPLGRESFFTARFIENSLQAGWMTLFFSLPIYLAMGVLFSAGPAFYGALAVVLICLSIIPTALAVLASLLLTTVFTAQRTKHVVIAVGVIAFVVLLILFRSIEPERFMNPDERATLLEVLGTLQSGDNSFLPSTWAHRALWPHLGITLPEQGAPLVLLVAGALASFFVAAWCFALLHPRAFSRAQEGLFRGEGGDAHKEHRGRSLDELTRALREKPGRLSMAGVIWRKDVRTFLRDTAQWSQLFLLAALVGIYLLNFRYIRTVSEGGFLSALTLHFLNLGLAGFVIVAIAVRFVFPAISLEGKAFWMIRRSPVPTRSFLRIKWATTAFPLLVMALILVVLTNLVLRADWVLMVSSLLTIAPMVLGAVAMGVGLGARYPRFGVDNAAKIAMGFGGVLYMILAVGMVVVVTLCAVPPTVALSSIINGTAVLRPIWMVFVSLSGLLVFLIPLFAGRTALHMGKRHLDQDALH